MAATNDIVGQGRNHGVHIAPPITTKTLDEMHRLAMVHGIETFLASGREFLLMGDWYAVSGEHETRLVRGREWELFCTNFSLYHEHWLRRIADEAKQAERLRQAEEMERQQAEAQRQREQDPEYIRQRAENRLAAAKEAEARRAQRKVEMFHRRCSESFASIELEEDGSPESYGRINAYYEIRNTLLPKIAAADEKQLKEYALEFKRLKRLAEK